MNERMKRRAKYRTWKKGYYHLCTDGKTGILCHDDAEYANLVNVIAVLPLKYRASRRLREDGHKPLPRDYDFKLIPVEDEDQMRRNIVYIARNRIN